MQADSGEACFISSVIRRCFAQIWLPHAVENRFEQTDLLHIVLDVARYSRRNPRPAAVPSDCPAAAAQQLMVWRHHSDHRAFPKFVAQNMNKRDGRGWVPIPFIGVFVPLAIWLFSV